MIEIAFIVRDTVTSNNILFSAVIILITAILARTTLYILEGLLKLFSNTSKSFNHRLIAAIETPTVVTIILVGLELAIRKILVSHDGFSDALLTAFIVILTYSLIRVGNLWLEHWSHRMTKIKGQEFHSEILPLTRSVISIVLSILGVILILQVWHIDIKTIITSLGVVGVILGIAFQQTLMNIFGGISLIMDNSFRQGDLVQLEDGSIGEVMEINLRSTKLKNFDSESVIVPNSQLANKKIINLAQPTPTVRIKIPLGVAYGSDPDKVKEVLHEAMRNHPDILKMPKRIVRFIEFGESSINFEIYFYINDYKKMWSTKDEVLTSVYKALYANNIEIPFPMRTVVNTPASHYAQKWKKEKKKKKRVTRPASP